jgi:hypothetical protein
VLGAYQAQQRDDYRDAELGKIVHELRYGELAHFRLIPHTPIMGPPMPRRSTSWRCMPPGEPLATAA